MNSSINENLITKPCVGCGFCCITAKCAAGQRLYKSSDICNALIWSDEDKRYYCDLMQLPGIIGDQYKEELYAGEGCCSNLNSWRKNVIKREVKKNKEIYNLDPMFQIFLRCLGREMFGGDSITLLLYSFQGELLKRNIDKNMIHVTTKLILHNIKNNRTKFNDEFMGGIEFKDERVS